jgi:hypothetical protein
LGAVLGIWGTIVFKIINGLNPQETIDNKENYDVTFSPKEIANIEPFKITNVERDPFLGTLTKKRSFKPKMPTKTNLKPEANRPIINYLGLIKQQQSSNQIYIVKINNLQHLLKKGQEIEGVKLLKGDENKITINFNSKNETIVIDN